ncbi:type III effector [Flavobacterium covae]|uniref:Type III effector n=2 Tax=Flavobacterium TaxID=237 RepID=A0AA94F2J3_9FLAO|nr:MULTISPECIES: HopJ type III effector protein [Flavobacterium]OXA83169.1 type III effector [Flavobacterium columnare] [Flavobacterium columnare NBRC 100251 = ATCC 23463]AND64766.1 type III effector [Flavobacterium covae]MCH4831095.1 HopJ type III effector protein [Flavobacterium columnare]MCH4832964.1 HopJ type III effector protein [Flavobacterium columnare]MCJ1806322.1 HopJ type III effector protein [Flavobacterium covae]
MDLLIQKIIKEENITFEEVIAHIDANYEFVPTLFKNGNQINQAGENNGSCKIFSFSLLHKLSKEQTLKLFGKFYQDVIATPEAEDHQNIRNFIAFGWDGIKFEKEAILPK